MKASLEVCAHLDGQNPSSVLILYHLKDVNTSNNYCFWTKVLGHEA